MALDGERVVGLASVHVMPILERDDPTARITAMVVEEAARRSGVGRALLERMEDVARAEGCGSALLCANCHAEVEAGIIELPQRSVPLRLLAT